MVNLESNNLTAQTKQHNKNIKHALTLRTQDRTTSSSIKKMPHIKVLLRTIIAWSFTMYDKLCSSKLEFCVISKAHDLRP